MARACKISVIYLSAPCIRQITHIAPEADSLQQSALFMMSVSMKDVQTREVPRTRLLIDSVHGLVGVLRRLLLLCECRQGRQEACR